MKFRLPRCAEIIRLYFLGSAHKFFEFTLRVPLSPKPREREVRNKLTRLSRDAQRRKRPIDTRRQLRQIRRGLHAAPENARPPLVRKKSQPAEMHVHRLRGMDRRERRANRLELRRVHFADEFQRHVHRFRPHPLGTPAFRLEPRDQIAERIAHHVREIERDE